jgi:molecular chaperone GrpE
MGAPDTSQRDTAGEAPEVERLRGDVQREHDMYLRALADFDNYRRRVDRDRASATESGNRSLILSLLEIADSFENALAHLTDAPESVVEGLQALNRKLTATLESQGVTPFSSRGEPFDPARHEAIGSVESGEVPPGSVADEVQRGYKWGETLLRPARVRVAQ